MFRGGVTSNAALGPRKSRNIFLLQHVLHVLWLKPHGTDNGKITKSCMTCSLEKAAVHMRFLQKEVTGAVCTATDSLAGSCHAQQTQPPQMDITEHVCTREPSHAMGGRSVCAGHRR